MAQNKISFEDYFKSDEVAVQEITPQDVFVDSPRRFDFTVFFLCTVAVICIVLTCVYYANSLVPVNSKVDISYVSTSGSSVQDGKVNINTADIETLCTLTGIGESKAFSIIAYRTANGGFESIEQIKEVSGIGEEIYNDIKDKICV